jgi:hypothetical protein
MTNFPKIAVMFPGDDPGDCHVPRAPAGWACVDTSVGADDAPDDNHTRWRAAMSERRGIASMTKAIIISFVVLGLSSPIASAACCQPQQYYNWGRVRQQNEMTRLRAIQGQQRVCNSIKSSGRNILWSGCR